MASKFPHNRAQYIFSFSGCLKLPKNHLIENFHTKMYKQILGEKAKTNVKCYVIYQHSHFTKVKHRPCEILIGGGTRWEIRVILKTMVWNALEWGSKRGRANYRRSCRRVDPNWEDGVRIIHRITTLSYSLWMSLPAPKAWLFIWTWTENQKQPQILD